METSLVSNEEQQTLAVAPPGLGANQGSSATLYHVLPEGAILAFPSAAGTPEGPQKMLMPSNVVMDKFNLVPLQQGQGDNPQYILTLAAYEEVLDGKPLHIHMDQPPLSPEPAPVEDPVPPTETEEVAIDVSKPIELGQNSVIVVNGQKCVLQQDPSSGKVVAYPVRPRRRRGRPRKSEAKSKQQQEAPVEDQVVEEVAEESSPEVPGEKGFMEISTEEGKKVKRSCRRKKKSHILKDYETEPLQELGSEEDQAAPRPEEEPLFPYRKKKANKIPGKRGPGRPSLASKEKPQTFIIQVESNTGQILHIKLQAQSLPDNNTLQAQLAKLGIKSNKIFPVPHPIAPLLQPSTEPSHAVEPSLEATSLIPVPGKRRPGRPRKHLPPADKSVTTTKPTFITLAVDGETEHPAETTSPGLLVPPEEVISLEQPPASYEQTIFSSPDDATQNVDTSALTLLVAADEKPSTDPFPSTELESQQGLMASYPGENVQSVSLLISEPSLEPAPSDIPSSALDPLINSSVGTCLFLTEDMSLSLATEPLFAEVNKTAVDLLPAQKPQPDDYKNEAEVQICLLCDFHSSSKPYFQHHLKTAHPDNFLKCDQPGCRFSALTQEEITVHAKEVHQHCICSECGHEENSPALMKKHMEKHSTKQFTCDICSKNYKDQYVLRMHRKLVHEPASTLYKCSVCAKTFNRKAHLKRHQRIHNPAKPFKCDYCEYRGCDRSVLKKHLLIHQEPRHTCDICGRTFRHLPNWHLHLKRHKGQRDYKCGACNFFGYTLTDIKKHIERRHKSAHVCQQCNSVFDTAALLQDHAQSCGSLVCIQNEEKDAVTISLSDLDLLMGKQSGNIIVVNQEGELLPTLVDGQQVLFNSPLAIVQDPQVVTSTSETDQLPPSS